MLPVPYAAQINDSACLPACAQMVLAYYGRKVSQPQLIRLLGTTDAGTPFSRLPLLSQLGATVDLGTNGTLAELQATLPVIVGLHAGWLPGHIVESQHAVVVIGIDPEGILILDPAQGADPILLSENEFLTAWIEMDIEFEPPIFGPSSSARIAAGMVISVDIPMFNARWGGLRIEDGYLVTQAAAEKLHDTPF